MDAEFDHYDREYQKLVEDSMSFSGMSHDYVTRVKADLIIAAAWWPHVFASSPKDFPLIDKDLLADTDWILADKNDLYCWNYLQHHRGKFIEQNFELVAENDNWRLYGRKIRVATSAAVRRM